MENKRKNHINLLKEFKAKTTFWRVKWLNKNLDLGSSGDEEENPNLIYENTVDESTIQNLESQDPWIKSKQQ